MFIFITCISQKVNDYSITINCKQTKLILEMKYGLAFHFLPIDNLNQICQILKPIALICF